MEKFGDFSVISEDDRQSEAGKEGGERVAEVSKTEKCTVVEALKREDESEKKTDDLTQQPRAKGFPFSTSAVGNDEDDEELLFETAGPSYRKWSRKINGELEGRPAPGRIGAKICRSILKKPTLMVIPEDDMIHPGKCMTREDGRDLEVDTRVFLKTGKDGGASYEVRVAGSSAGDTTRKSSDVKEVKKADGKYKCKRGKVRQSVAMIEEKERSVVVATFPDVEGMPSEVENLGRSRGNRLGTVLKSRLFLAFFAVCSFLVVVVSLCAFAAVHIKYKKQTVCESEQCIVTAEMLKSAMNLSANPCVDFFEYACGSWVQHHPVPTEKAAINTFEVLADKVQLSLRTYLEEPVNGRDNQAIIKAKKFYKSCVNSENYMNKIDKDEIVNLTKKFGGWPMLDSTWDEKNVPLVEEVIGSINRFLDDGIIIRVLVAPDDKNALSNVLGLEQGNLGLPGREYYFKNLSTDPMIRAYHTYMVESMVMWGVDFAEASDEMEQVLLFETELAILMIPDFNRQDHASAYTKLTLYQLIQTCPGTNWELFFKSSLHTDLDDSEPIVTYAFDYMQRLSDLINRTPRRIIQNYIAWRVAMNDITVYYVGEVQEIRLRFKNKIYGVFSEEPRWSDCVVLINRKMGLALGALFVRNNFTEENREIVSEMIYNIRESFKELVDTNTWMDEETKILAKEKIDAINAHVGYPSYILNDTHLESEYESMVVAEDDFLQTVQNMHHVSFLRLLQSLREEVKRDKWSVDPAVVNAFYNPNKNDIVFPAAILQPAFYGKDYPASLNYGGIGVVIGHEITHGFDDKGRLFDKDGYMKEWWNNATIQAFVNQTRCIIQQYSSYPVEGVDPSMNLTLNGEATQGENIADNGALKQSYKAYKKYAETRPEEPLLPGLDLTHDQLFFLNYAQIWCGAVRPEEALLRARTAIHAPGKWRVIGPLSNSADFAQAYECPAGSLMNPEQKCYVW